MSMTTTAVVAIVILMVLLFLGMNIGMAMLTVGFFGYWHVVNFKGALGLLATVPTTQASNYALTVIPLFIMLGNFAFASGMSSGMYACGNKWLSRLPGGLACATVAACAAFGAICGSTQATAATMGVVAIPEMRKYGYDDALSTGSVSAGGTLGIMIPPSSAMIMYGIMAEVSIGQVFAAGILPGILMALLCIITIIILVSLKPSLAPPSQSVSWGERFRSLTGIIPMVVVFAAVFGGMFSGVFTINESAAVGAFLGLLIMIVMRKFTWRKFISVMVDTVKTTAMTYLILVGAMVFSGFLAVTKLPMTLASTVDSLDVNRYVILMVIVLIYAFMGCLMDALPMMMLTVPIFLPVVRGLGFDDIWFGIIIIVVWMLGLITPPVGMSCYVISGIAKDVPLMTIFRGSIPFVVPFLLTIIILAIFPQLALWLPGVIY